MKLLAFVWPALFAVTSTCAMAQWQWLDKDGHKVFSDRPPPADVPEKRIVSRPKGYGSLAGIKSSGTATGLQEAASPEADAKPAAAPVDKAAGKDKELEAKKLAAEKAEADKKRDQEARNQAVKADNCQRARQAQSMFATGRAIRMPNEQGQMVYLNDAQRADEVQRVDQAIASNCE
ncbi:DUF4124 domain-containing protein [Comamonas humi]